MVKSFAFSFLTKLYQKNVAYTNFINFIEYSGKCAIRKIGVVTRYESRCIPLACVNSFRSCNSIAANQYLMFCSINDMKTTEPDILRRGKAFHKRVQDDWERTAKGGNLTKEHTIELSQISASPRRKRRGRLDLFVGELGDYVSVVEIKSTDWDKVKENNRKKLLGSHRRQIWKYIEEYLDIEKIDVCPGIMDHLQISYSKIG